MAVLGRRFTVFTVTLFLVLVLASAVDRSKFRTCQDTGFCRRYRGKEFGPVFGSSVSS